MKFQSEKVNLVESAIKKCLFNTTTYRTLLENNFKKNPLISYYNVTNTTKLPWIAYLNDSTDSQIAPGVTLNVPVESRKLTYPHKRKRAEILTAHAQLSSFTFT